MGRPHPLLSKNTELGPPPLVPELELHLANDAAELCRMTTKELKDNIFPFPFWTFAWAGWQTLARAISDNPQLIKDKPVLGTGAGSGLVGLSALFGFAFNIDFRKVAVFTSKA